MSNGSSDEITIDIDAEQTNDDGEFGCLYKIELYLKRNESKIVYSFMAFSVIYTIIALFPYLLLYNQLFFPNEDVYKINYMGNRNIELTDDYINKMFYNYSKTFKKKSIYDKLIFDNRYHPLIENKVIDYLKYDKTNYLKYKSEARDCDDFSIMIYGTIKRFQGYYYNSSLAIGMIIGKTTLESENGHVINIFINDKYEIKCFAPQDDKVDDCNKMMEVLYEIIM